MAKKLLIDATHEEETRVAMVTEDGRLEDYDIESLSRKLLKGNVFLAKVTRVEPSLQAAFVDYGGNRHGFLPFSEIHPDYYRIPIADKEALMEEEEKLLQKIKEAEDASEDGELDPEEAARIIDELTRDDKEAETSKDAEAGDAKEEDAKAEETEKPKAKAKRQSRKKKAVAKDENGDANGNVKEAEASEETDVDGNTKEEKPKKPRGRKSAASETDEVVADAPVEANADEEEKPKAKAKRKPKAKKEDKKDETAEKKPAKSKKKADDSADEPKEKVKEEAKEATDDQATEGQSADAQNSEEGDDNRQKRGGRYRNRGRRGRGGNRNSGRGNRGGNNRNDDEFDNPLQPLWKKIRRSYKIQEVIKRGQIMLIQVSKEERGNKGAAVTSYVTLPGRYCVLMPNSSQGGGVSRKITDRADRKRMRETLKSLDVPKGMSTILRTAGVTRTKAEIKRDLTYLTRLWNSIRELTLKSTAPAEIHEEGNIIQRVVRDVYSKEYDGIEVAGERGYKEAKTFMKMMMPTHAKKVTEYKEDIPLFVKHDIEKQIDAMNEPTVQLKSGGYLVINPTEALVSVDVNSGRATKERHIEETALKTNLEAADEVARQLRLRDLGGLVVIDFIDMENRRNNRQVEKRIAQALSKDRAKVQCSQISMFGLLELSRQRLRPSVNEKNFTTCPHCQGSGLVRTVDGAALVILREIEQEGLKGKAKALTIQAPADVVMYLHNQKRADIVALEQRYNFSVTIEIGDNMGASDYALTTPGGGNKNKNKNANNNKKSDGQKDNRRKKQQSNKKQEPKADNNDAQNQEKPAAADKNQRRGRRPKNKANEDVKQDAPKADASASQETANQAAPEAPKTDKEEKGRKAASSKDKKPAKSTAKAAPKKKAEEKPAKVVNIEDAPKPTEEKQEPTETKPDYTVISEAKGKKKKGWWSKILD